MAIDKNKLDKAKANIKATEPTPEDVKGFFDDSVVPKASAPKVEPSKAKVEVPEPKKAEEKKQTIRESHKVYSFWANKEQIEVWKCYQEASSALGRAQDLGLVAIAEYIKNHPLQGDEEIIYNAKLRQKGLEESSFK